MPLCQPPVELLEYSRNRKWTPKTPSSCTSRCRTGIDALALRHPWNGAVQRPSRRTRVHSPLSCAAPSERLSKQFQRHAMRHGIFELPNAVINGASELLVHLSPSGVLGSAISALLLASSRSALELQLALAVCVHLPSHLQQPAPDWPCWALLGPVAKAPWAGVALFSLSYDGSPVTRRRGGTGGDNRKTLGDGWRRKWAHFAVPVA